MFIDEITEQVCALGQEDATRRLASTTTTVKNLVVVICFVIDYSHLLSRLSQQKPKQPVKLMLKVHPPCLVERVLIWNQLDRAIRKHNVVYRQNIDRVVFVFILASCFDFY